MPEEVEVAVVELPFLSVDHEEEDADTEADERDAGDDRLLLAYGALPRLLLLVEGVDLLRRLLHLVEEEFVLHHVKLPRVLARVLDSDILRLVVVGLGDVAHLVVVVGEASDGPGEVEKHVLALRRLVADVEVFHHGVVLMHLPEAEVHLLEGVARELGGQLVLLRIVGQVSVARYLLGVDAPSHLDASLGVAAHVGGEVVFAVPHALAHLVVAVGLLEVVLLDAEVGHVAEDLILRLPVGIFAAEGERLLVVIHALLVVEEVGIGVANQVVEFRDVGLLLTLLVEFHALHAQVERLDVAGAGDIEFAHLHVGEDARLLLLLRHVRPEASADQRV